MEQGWASKKQKQPFCKNCRPYSTPETKYLQIHERVGVFVFPQIWGILPKCPLPSGQGNGVFCATWYLNCSLCLVRLSPLLTGLLELTHLC